MPDHDETIFELTDVQVDTLGLVSRGANREDGWFMLKSDTEGTDIVEEPIDTNKMQEADFTEVEEKITKSVWQKLIGLFKKGNITIEENVDESTNVKETEKATMLDQMTGGMDNMDSATMDEDEEETDKASEPTNKEEATTEEVAEHIEETQKGDATMPENEEFISKAEFEKAQAELAEVKKALDEAKEEKVKLEWVNKSAAFGYAPVASTELAEHLYAIAKLDATQANWLVDLLKSYDAMLADSGLFVEKGSTIVPDSELEKALKSDNVREALLGMDRKSAENFLSQMREISRR